MALFAALVALIALAALVAGCGPASDDDDDAGDDSGGDDDAGDPQAEGPYTLPDTGQTDCYDEMNQVIACPSSGNLFGQDAQYTTNAPSYTDNGDGTVTDNVTGLMWQQTPGDKMTWDEAANGADGFELAGYDDWRLPSIDELYSLIDFAGATGTGSFEEVPDDAIPYIDTDVFDFEYGDTGAGERFIDAQYWSATKYVSTTMDGNETAFGVNFADGRIKGYGLVGGAGDMTEFVRYVRGNAYGGNDFASNGDGTITDNATGLMWTEGDSGSLGGGDGGAMDWPDALAWCEALSEAGYDDWRLPNAKELQGLVDYSRSPATTDSAAIDPLFTATPIVDEGGGENWAYYWTSTTHDDGPDFAAYIAFGEALGCMEIGGSGEKELMDVHGAGAQRSDPKTMTPESTIGCGDGPQGDVLRVLNFARCVRGGV
ncbi:MAG: DUF1566 domain-containing protein [Deltaproteobacteria bacterium]|nr:DUF1566 domain-containing protein [Deltaproteobacteria bacterium]